MNRRTIEWAFKGARNYLSGGSRNEKKFKLEGKEVSASLDEDGNLIVNGELSEDEKAVLNEINNGF
ncbi:hypothetical protein HC823_02535 [Candidatus Gracilibacteria bacterium]|nr:hypothetical protein [Candidatus Gracilibacteria bacterium]